MNIEKQYNAHIENMTLTCYGYPRLRAASCKGKYGESFKKNNIKIVAQKQLGEISATKNLISKLR